MHWPSWLVLSALAGLSLITAGCAEREPGEPLLPANRSTPGLAASAPEPLAPISFAMARALSDPTLRRQVLEDLRDSPFPGHKIHLQSYLEGERGLTVARVAAQAVGMGTDEWLRKLRDLPPLEFSATRSYDRVSWAGTDDIVVIATIATQREISSAERLPAFNVRGEAVHVPVLGPYDRRPQLHILPAMIDFGRDPETMRAAAPKRSGTTISTREEEFATTECDPYTAVMECDDSSAPGDAHGGYSLDSSFSYSACTTSPSPDSDSDGIRDDCEYQLAHTFRPFLQVSKFDGNLSREPYWAVVKGDPGILRIFYALAYHRDGGGASNGLGAHAGDSEFVILTVKEIATARWVMDTGTLSAHWGECCGFDMSGTWSYTEFEFPEVHRGRPRVWVSEEKHANYRTKSHCGGGAYLQDTCEFNDITQEVEVLTNANLGSSWDPERDCVFSRNGYEPFECFWDTQWFGFWGWQSETDGASPYHKSLGAYSF